VLTSGYNREGPQRFDEHVFVFDVASFPPRQIQAVPVPNSFCGIAWNPNGQEFYVSGGVDDRVYVFTKGSSNRFTRTASISLGHGRGNGLLSNLPQPLNAQAPKPMVAGIAVNQSGTVGIVANFYNDSVSFVDLKTRKKTGELDLRPGVIDKTKVGVPGGEYPYWIAVQGDAIAYVTSPRDREIVVVNLGQQPSVSARIAVHGQPNRLLLNRAQNRLFVAQDNADEVSVISTETNQILSTFNVWAPAARSQDRRLPKGANPN